VEVFALQRPQKLWAALIIRSFRSANTCSTRVLVRMVGPSFSPIHLAMESSEVFGTLELANIARYCYSLARRMSGTLGLTMREPLHKPMPPRAGGVDVNRRLPQSSPLSGRGRCGSKIRNTVTIMMLPRVRGEI
jgi:hypothetical protein